MAYHLAIMMPDQWQHIVATQRGRLVTDDERREFDFVSRACNPDVEVQERLFGELLQPQNRRVEPWARAMLTLLNDPVREPFGNRYLVPGLDALEEVQRTGDIFFPKQWVASTLRGHHAPEADTIVATFLEEHPDYPPLLKNKILQAAAHGRRH
jgi:aminopeptidase N